MKRLLFFVAFMTLGTLALIQLLVTEPLQTQGPVTQESLPENVLNMEGVQVHQLDGARVRWELEAERATYNENTNAGALEQVRFRVFDTPPGGGQQTVFTGRSARARLSPQPGSLVLEGGVVLSQGRELEIRSERIEYDQAKQLITAPGPVTVRTTQGVQEGKSLRYYVAEQRLDFESPTFYQ